MNKSDRTYERMLSLLEQEQPALFSREEIAATIGTPAATVHGTPRRSRWAALLVGVAAVAALGIWLWPAGDTKPGAAQNSARGTSAAQSIAGSPAQRSSAQAGTPSPAPASPAPASTAPASTASNVPEGPATGAGTTGAAPNVARPASTRSHQNVMRPDVMRPARTIAAAARHRGAVNTPAAVASESRDAGANDAGISDLGARTAIGTGIPTLDLTPEELRPLGVTIANGTLRTFAEERYTLATASDRARFAAMGVDTAAGDGIVRKLVSLGSFGATTTDHAWTRVEGHSPIAPVIAQISHIGNVQGPHSWLISFERAPILDEARRTLGPKLDALTMAVTLNSERSTDAKSDVDTGLANPARNLVPVHIHLEHPGNGAERRASEVILWYYPTREFVDALPERYRRSLQKEMNVMADVHECNLPPSEACLRMTGEMSLLNFCGRASGALKGLSVSPNPASGTFTLRYSLDDRRLISAALYNMRGAYVRDIMPAAQLAAGAHSATVKLKGVQPGAYIVLLHSEQGEQISERLIVQ